MSIEEAVERGTKTALESQKPSYDDFKWHPENIPSGKTFTIPPRKLYEIYVYTPSGDVLLDGIGLTTPGGGTIGGWFPMAFESQATFTGYAARPAGAGYDADVQGAPIIYSTNPRGWIFSEGQVLSNSVPEDWRLIWRDVTKLYTR